SPRAPPRACHWEPAPAGAIIIWTMSRVVVAAIVVGLWPGAAAAKPMQRVRVETDPKNASVYVNDKETGVACVTPCDVELPPGANSLIIELKDYVPDLVSVDVKTPKKTIVVKRSLKKSIGTLDVAGAGAANGAKIEVDGTDVGKVAPAKVEVEAGTH